MATWALLPLLAAAVLRRTRRTELAPESLKPSGIRAWRIPLPGPGFRVLLEGGSHRDLLLPPGAARALGATGADPFERFALARPLRSPWWAALKFGAFPLLPALVVFRAFQVINYGGLMGESQLYGFNRWAMNLAGHWVVTVAVVAAWAALLRVAAEATSFIGALAGARAAAVTRRGAEIASALAYYAGIPAVLAVMFLR